MLAATYCFPSLQQVAFVRRTFWNNEELISEGRFFLTSLPRNRLSARRFLKAVTAHWEIENSLHNVKDKHWREDKQYTSRTSLGCVQSVMRNFALNILRVMESPYEKGAKSLSAKAMHLLAQPLKALRWLGTL